MKRVLLITYHFPPDGAVGSVRAAKFAKYLPEFGWEATILTVKPKYCDVLDTNTIDVNSSGIPVVIRTGMFRNPSFYYRKIKRRLRSNGTKAYVSPPETEKAARHAQTAFRTWIDFLLSFPDEQTGWIPFGFIKGMQALYRKNTSVLMTSGPPHSVHLLGMLLSKLTHVPWVADFRDPWLDSYLSQLGIQQERYARFGKRLEARFMAQAACIVTTTPRFTDRLRSKYPAAQAKVLAIPNGYDPEEFLGVSREKEQRFTISYLGSLYYRRDPEPVLSSIAELMSEGHISPDQLAVRFIGDCHEAEGKAVKALIAKYGLTGIVEILPWLPRSHALEIMTRSHLLLLLAEDQPLQIPGKVYDYLGSGSQILAITGDGATADLLRETGAGIVVAPGDREALKEVIKKFYASWLIPHQSTREYPFMEAVPPSGYSRRQLTAELALLLEEVSQ
jgi:glycosyltransferase involved in cell wall biosynthesis